MNLSKEVTAFLFATLVAATTVPISVATFIALVEGLPNGVSLGGALAYFIGAMVCVAIAGLLVGLPTVWILRRTGLMQFPVLCVTGLLFGAGINWLFLPTFPLFIGAIAGVAAAVTWWLITDRRTIVDA